MSCVSVRVTAVKRVHDFTTYGRLLCQLNLLRQAHQQDLWSLGNPFLVQLLLGRCALDIVGRLEALQQAGKGVVDFGRQDRHGVCSSWGSWAAPVEVAMSSEPCSIRGLKGKGLTKTPSVGGGGFARVRQCLPLDH